MDNNREKYFLEASVEEFLVLIELRTRVSLQEMGEGLKYKVGRGYNRQ